MFRIYHCIRTEHDLRLVLVAGLICVVAAISVVTLLRQGRDARREHRPLWLAGTGLASGFGIWATHFIAMMGYDPGIVVGYRIEPTVASLLVAALATSLGFRQALTSNDRRARWLAASTIGLGIGAMHYLGMMALQLPARLSWSPGYVVASLVLAVVCIKPALSLSIARRGGWSAAAAASLIVLSILLLHFTGMAGITIMPERMDDPPALLLSPFAMGIAVACAAFCVLVIGIAAALIGSYARAKVQARERELQLLVKGITDCALYLLDDHGNVTSWNAGAERLNGLPAAEAIGRNFASFYSGEDRAAGLPQRALAIAAEAGKFTAEGWQSRCDGDRFWAAITIEPVLDEDGTRIGFAQITRDISRQKEDQDRLAALTAKLDAALTNMHQGLVLVDAAHQVGLVNARFRTMYRLAGDVALEGMGFGDFMRTALSARNGKVDDQRVDLGLEWMRACLAQPGGGGTVTIDFEDQSVIDVSYRALPTGGFVATFEDVSERHRSAARIAHMAMHDDLTGLSNRVNFNAALDSALAEAGDMGGSVAIVAIDLDNFKEINDTHGHATGDHVLATLAERMGASVRGDEMVARFGGDEFAAFCPATDPERLESFLDRLKSALTAPIERDGLQIKPAASLGVAVYPADGGDREQLLGNADLAMYRAKATHGLQVCRYTYGMDESSRLRRVMAMDLRAAIAGDQLSLAFQVQQAVEDGAITGHEALLRWRHPVYGWISPADFIPIAEESGSIVEIGEWVLRNACRIAAGWSQPHRVAINLSPIQLGDPKLVPTITQILLETGLPPSRLELEITETAIIADRATALHILRQIKALGVTIAIDDFGTGYSSLETLHSFPFDKIKIDRSFVMQAERSEQARAIIRAVVALGHSLKMPVLAEGVETAAQLEFLRDEGCSEAQGYLLGRPQLRANYEQVAA